jgi:hypothetical protein
MTKQAQDNADQNTDPNSQPGSTVTKCKVKVQDREGKIKTRFAQYWRDKWDKYAHDLMHANASNTPQGTYGTYTLQFKVDYLGNIYPNGPAVPKKKNSFYWGTEGGTSKVISGNLRNAMEQTLFDAHNANPTDFADPNGSPTSPLLPVTIGPQRMDNGPADVYGDTDASQTGAQLL